MLASHRHANRIRLAALGLAAATALAGCVQLGTGRGQQFPEESAETETETVPETGDSEGLEGSEVSGDVGDEATEPPASEDIESTEG